MVPARDFATTSLILVGVLTAACGPAPQLEEAPEPTATDAMTSLPAITYPETRKVDQVDQYHGETIADPYRWLEELDSDDTRDWIARQNTVTDQILEQLPARPRIRERIEAIWNYEKFGVPFEKGGRYFYFRNDGLQNQSVLFVRESLDGEPRVLLDPNAMSQEGTVAVSSLAVSRDGKRLAYGLSEGGSDWQTIHVRDVDSGTDLEDRVQWVKFSGPNWTPDGAGFYYSRYDEPTGEDELKAVNYHHKLYYHRVGTAQSQDEIVYERPDEKEWGFGARVSDDGRYLVIHVWKGTHPENQLFYKDLRDPDSEVVELLAGFDASYRFIGNDADRFFVQTDNDAPRSRIVAIDLARPEPSAWTEVIAQRRDTIEGATIVNQRFIVNYLHDAANRVQIFSLQGRPQRAIDLPGIGSVNGFSGAPDDSETFYSFTSFTAPTTVYRYDLEHNRREVFAAPEVDFSGGDFVTRQVFYESKDGTKVPMFISHRKDLQKNGRLPVLLYGYGGFNISLTPSFSIPRAVWMEMGGVYAVANLRGGGEYGETWHEAGIVDKKQNVFDDFIAAAEFLVSEGYTSSDHIAIQGGSNGGLLVAAAMTQRPELFEVALPAVGVLDMLRFDQFTIGWAWRSDYGDPADPDDYRALRAYSPLHNLHAGTDYPATLITTADHDDRVFPAHSFKYAAALQAAHAGSDPVLIRVETKAGHGAGKPTSKQIDEAADVLAFAWTFVGEA